MLLPDYMISQSKNTYFHSHQQLKLLSVVTAINELINHFTLSSDHC